MNRRIEDIGKKQKNNNMFYLLVVLLSILAVIGLVFLSTFIGNVYQNYLSGQAGYVYQVVLEYRECAYNWAGVFGAAVMVKGYNNQQSLTVSSCGMYDVNLLFNCLQPAIDHEIMASQVPPTDIDWNSLQPATTADVDAYIGDTISLMSASKTFTKTITYQIGNQYYVVPGTYTKKYNENNSTVFDMGILKDGNGNLIYVTHILSNFTRGFNNKVYNYQMILPIRNGTNPTYYFFSDPNDVCPEGEGESPNSGYVEGNATTNTGQPLEGVIVDVKGYTTLTDVNGHYFLTIPEGKYYIFGIRTGYQTYIGNVSISAGNTTYHNMVLVAETIPNKNTGQGIGPGTDFGKDVGRDFEKDIGPGEAPRVPIIEQPKRIEGIDYVISVAKINKKLVIGNFLQEVISFYSYKPNIANLKFRIDGEEIKKMIKLDKQTMSVAPNTNEQLTLTIFGEGKPGIYNGTLVVEGDLQQEIPITIELLDKERLPVESLLLMVDIFNREIFSNQKLKFKTDLYNLLSDQTYPVSLQYTIQNSGGETIWSDSSNVYLQTSFSLLKTASLPTNLPTGDYVLRVTATYLGLSSGASAVFSVVLPFYEKIIWGLKVWMWIIIFLFLVTLLLIYWFAKRYVESKKRYHNKVELSELPKPGPRAAFVGKIAETEHKAYFDLEQFKLHTIVAGATGGGKSVAAQVIVEEALLKNVAVIVFDPTAQWSGMLRKGTDKSMLKLYPSFGMKPNQARAFNGNVRQITNPLEVIDIKKYIKPGEIQILALNKLDPKDIDIFVANSVREVFHANFPETPELKLLLVYDEVHRLLPKFGGSGEGFLQIERGCREFRKWGIGILLISQVLADFVGQIKANINTEIQMRTRDEGDLERIKTKYGPEVLQGLVKASVGTGMIENPTYNRGKPYFVSFRPLLHNTQRLSDEELEKYNKYNEQIEDLQYQIEQLEELKQDVFDLRLQLKLSLEKIKQGNFNMVEIYLQELVPRIEKMWVKLGKTPKKKKMKLVDVNDLKEEVRKAEESRKEFEKNNHQIQIDQKEEKKVLKYEKVVDFKKSLNFNNGVSVTSLQELLDVMPNINGLTFKYHVNSERNDIADWVEKNFDKELAEKLRSAKNNNEYVKILEEDKAKNNKPIEDNSLESKDDKNSNKKDSNNDINTGNDLLAGSDKLNDDTVLDWNSLKKLLKNMPINQRINLLEKSLKKYPNDLNILFSLGLLYHKMKKDDLSEAVYRKILSLDPNNAKALYYLAGLYKSQKRIPEAINYFKKYLQYNDDDKIKALVNKMASEA